MALDKYAYYYYCQHIYFKVSGGSLCSQSSGSTVAYFLLPNLVTTVVLTHRCA